MFRRFSIPAAKPASPLFMVLLAAAVWTPGFAGQAPAQFELIGTADSAGGSFVVEEYNCKTNDLRRIWVVDREDSTNRALLFEHGRSATVIFSPDEKWLVVNHYEGSTDAAPILFRQKAGVRYERVRGIDLDRIVWKAAASDQGFPANTDFDHRYSEVMCWLGAQTILLRAWGHHSGEHWLDDWFCLYDIKRRKVSFDLKPWNKDAFQKAKKPRS